MSYYFARYTASFVPPACLYYSHHVLESARGMIPFAAFRAVGLHRLCARVCVFALCGGRPRVTCIHDRPADICDS